MLSYITTTFLVHLSLGAQELILSEYSKWLYPPIPKKGALEGGLRSCLITLQPAK